MCIFKIWSFYSNKQTHPLKRARATIDAPTTFSTNQSLPVDNGQCPNSWNHAIADSFRWSREPDRCLWCSSQTVRCDCWWIRASVQNLRTCAFAGERHNVARQTRCFRLMAVPSDMLVDIVEMFTTNTTHPRYSQCVQRIDLLLEEIACQKESNLIGGHSTEHLRCVLFANARCRVQRHIQETTEQPHLTRTAQRAQYQIPNTGHIRVSVTRPQEVPFDFAALTNGRTVDDLTQIDRDTG